MCIQCAAGAMTAVAGATGSRIWLQARFPALADRRVGLVLRRGILVAGVLAAGLVGPAAHGSDPPPKAAAPSATLASATAR
ncbi:hypothetical protein SK069_01305 [Patulibacter brassicae]|uniref:Uncharacterized protein n=1 Tax=Patulibacter brassicae TaxID=1705717 RepID=A0ABU4VEJ1_9ACTN|nr:hypothetical protein [Patulibacter brassicae]MDX8150218.1 hypothetical protein [Patulibacter brassicae]